MIVMGQPILLISEARAPCTELGGEKKRLCLLLIPPVVNLLVKVVYIFP